MRKARERPRTTKNVYFFKSGDPTFPGIRLPVNTRRYKHLDSVLDDLSYRIPLARGVRTLSTPRGRDKVTDLAQLRHLGSYVCSDLLQARRVPGVDLSKIKGPDLQLVSSNNSSGLYEGSRAEPSTGVRKTIKKKKRRRRKKKPVPKLLLADEAENLVAMIQERILNTGKSESPELEEQEYKKKKKKKKKNVEKLRDQPVDDYPDGQTRKRLNDLGETINEKEEEGRKREQDAEEEAKEGKKLIVDTREYGGIYVGEDVRQKQLDEQRTGSSATHEGNGERIATTARSQRTGSLRRPSKLAPQESRPPTRSAFGSGESRSEGQKDLPPLDGDKLTHVQRRRLASNQVDSERYTLPSGSSGVQSGTDGERKWSGDVFRSANGVEADHQKAIAKDDVESLRVDELLSLSDEPATTAPRSISRAVVRHATGGPQARPKTNPSNANPKRDVQSRQMDSGVSWHARP